MGQNRGSEVDAMILWKDARKPALLREEAALLAALPRRGAGTVNTLSGAAVPPKETRFASSQAARPAPKNNRAALRQALKGKLH